MGSIRAPLFQYFCVRHHSIHLCNRSLPGLASAGLDSALVLVIIVFTCSLLARVATARMEKMQRGS